MPLRRNCTYACSASHCEEICPAIRPYAFTAFDASSVSGDENNSLKIAVSLYSSLTSFPRNTNLPFDFLAGSPSWVSFPLTPQIPKMSSNRFSCYCFALVRRLRLVPELFRIVFRSQKVCLDSLFHSSSMAFMKRVHRDKASVH